METPENGPKEEEKEESRFGEPQADDLTPLESGESEIPFSGSQEAGGEGNDATQSENPEDLTTEGDPPPPEGGGPPPEAFEPYPGPEQGPTPPWPGGAPEKGPDVTPGPPPEALGSGPGSPDLGTPVSVPSPEIPRLCPSCEGNMMVHGPGCPELGQPIVEPDPPKEPAWVGETSRSGRRAGGKPGRKPGRKPGPKAKTAEQRQLEEDNPMVVVQPAPHAPILVASVKFMDVAQIFNNAKGYLRVSDPMSGGYSHLELWVDRGILWVRRWNIKEEKHETNCVPLSNVQSFVPA